MVLPDTAPLGCRFRPALPYAHTPTHIKTTIEISDGLLKRAKALAQREGTTVRALVEAGLRLVLKEQPVRTKFTLRDASFGGQGMAPELEGASWERIRDAIYEGRGT